MLYIYPVKGFTMLALSNRAAGALAHGGGRVDYA